MEDSEQKTMSLFATREDFTLALVGDLKTAAEKLHGGLSDGGLSKTDLAARWVDLLMAADLLLLESPTMRRCILSDDQAEALRIMLGYYGNDPRVACLRELVEGE